MPFLTATDASEITARMKLGRHIMTDMEYAIEQAAQAAQTAAMLPVAEYDEKTVLAMVNFLQSKGFTAYSEFESIGGGLRDPSKRVLRIVWR